jgi:hypothetical protein
MATQLIDRTIDRRVSWTHGLYVKKADGTAENVAGWTSYLVVKKVADTDPTDSKAVINTSQTNATNVPAGDLSIAVSYDQLDIPEGVYKYSMKYKKADGSVIAVCKGKYVIDWTGQNKLS